MSIEENLNNENENENANANANANEDDNNENANSNANEGDVRSQASWYVIYAKPKQEPLAHEHLQRQNYESFCPMAKRIRRRNMRRVEVTEPMFPRYLFVRLCPSVDNYSPIRSTRGVMHIVRFGVQMAKVPDDFIACLMDQQSADLDQPKVATYKQGDSVRILSGPFAEYEAIFQNDCAQERACVLLKIAEKATRIKVQATELEKVS